MTYLFRQKKEKAAEAEAEATAATAASKQKTRRVFALACAAAAMATLTHMEPTMAADERRTNVLGQPLVACCTQPPTGFRRDGYCAAQSDDYGAHIVCSEVTAAFLQFSESRGNDLTRSHPQMGFKGLVPGDRWCLCVSRWKEALDAKVAPPVFLERTDMRALQTVTLASLQDHAKDASAAP